MALADSTHLDLPRQKRVIVDALSAARHFVAGVNVRQGDAMAFFRDARAVVDLDHHVAVILGRNVELRLAGLTVTSPFRGRLVLLIIFILVIVF